MQNVDWMDGWVIPLRLVRLLEHLAVLIMRNSEEGQPLDWLVTSGTKLQIQSKSLPSKS